MKKVIISLEHSIIGPDGGIGQLTCIPDVCNEEEIVELERGWEQEIGDVELYTSWVGGDEMIEVVRKVRSFWKRRGYQIIWRHYEDIIEDKSIKEVSEETIRELAYAFEDEDMQATIGGQKFYVVFGGIDVKGGR